MKAYRATYWDAHLGLTLSWHSSEVAARRWVADYVETAGPSHGPSGVERVEIPTTRGALLQWLNRNCYRDNG